MKIDRRSFLAFGVGGAVGTAITPLPWKLMDDSSIWSQNWPWTPVPLDGAINYQPSVCTLCKGGCGINVRKIDDRPVKIEGLKANPINKGGICLLGLSGLQLLYGEDNRVKSPLKRVGKRGSGKFKKISWQQAITEMVEKLGAIRLKAQSHTLACISETELGTTASLIGRFMTAFGSKNYIRTPSFLDSLEAAILKTTGTSAAQVAFDFENSDYILSFGSGLLEGWGSPVRMFMANSALEDKKGTLAQAEPRLSNTAAKADKWLPVNPGTEADLAFSMCAVIIQKALYNTNFTAAATGLEGFKSFVTANYAPEKIAKSTGIKAEVITRIATSFAKAKNPVAVCGKGSGDTPGSLKESLAIVCLNALVGNINKKGGLWLTSEPDYIKWPEFINDDASTAGLQKNRIDSAQSGKYKDTRFLLNNFADAVLDDYEYPVNALMVYRANPMYTMPDSEKVKKAFEKIPFVMSFSSYMDETALYSDLILPDHVFLERYEDIPFASGYTKPYIGLARPVVDPLFDTMNTGDVIIQIAKRISNSIAGAFPWKDYETCLKETLGSMWAQLESQGFMTDQSYTPPSTVNFTFPDKIADAPAIEGDRGKYLLTLVPVDSIRINCGYIANPPFATKTVDDTVLFENDILVEINPATAKSLGLRDRKKAVLETPKGKASVRVFITDGIMPGVVGMPKGLGHFGYDSYIADKGVNVNALIGSLEDPETGLDAAWGIRAKLSPA